MRKILLLGIIAVVAIGAAAFTSSEPKESQASLQVLYWYDEFGNFTERMNTLQDEITASGCGNTSSVVCERGYEASDLIDVEDPSLGVDPEAEVDGEIFKD